VPHIRNPYPSSLLTRRFAGVREVTGLSALKVSRSAAKAIDNHI
jgi:hypothetical protein